MIFSIFTIKINNGLDNLLQKIFTKLLTDAEFKSKTI